MNLFTEDDHYDHYKDPIEESIKNQFTQENMSEVENLHIHQRIEKLENEMKTQRRVFKFIRKALGLLLK